MERLVSDTVFMPILLLVALIVFVAVCYLFGIAWIAVVKWLWRNIRK